MAAHEIRDAAGRRWGIETSKDAAMRTRAALNVRQRGFGPFTVRPVRPGEELSRWARRYQEKSSAE